MASFSILLPHYRTGKISAYAVSQLVKLKGKHDIQIIVIDNSNDDSINHILLTNLRHECEVIHYPKDKLQTHGIAFDFCLQNGYVKNEWFITVESDSFPTEDNWLDYYEKIIKDGYDGAGSLLSLSGGLYMHPCGALYKQSIWKEMEEWCKTVPYMYFPNMAMKEKFPCHLMVHKDFIDEFTENPRKYIELDHSYEKLSPGEMILKAYNYEPVCHPFHYGMGTSQESFNTYRFRTIDTETKRILFDGSEPNLVWRMGAEPGQLFGSWMLAKGYKLKYIPTQVKWMPHREQQQQEYTLMENGFTHLWAVTAYDGCTVPELQDIVQFKSKQMNALYDSLPENYKL